MENFLPALLIIGGIIYKIYSEYQKEQEKARRRMPQTRPPSHPQETFEQLPRPPIVDPTLSMPMPAIPNKERSQNVSQEIRRRHLAKNSVTPTVVPPIVNVEEVNENTPAFDLRAAVIHSAILNRPYQ